MEHISKAQVKQIRSLQQKKYRDELGLFVAEGEKCVSELLKAFEPVTLVREGENATRTEIEQMSGLRTPQGVVCVFRKPSGESFQPSAFSHQNSGLILALDGIQDPGNLGTIIRTCDWFGVHDIVCSLDTADCYNPKVVQATMGALARVRVHYVNLVEWLSDVSHQPSAAIYGTLLEGKDMYQVFKEQSESPTVNSQSSIVVMGNEGNGISAEVRQLITHPIRIPSYPKDAETSESLNVSIATAIVLAEFRRP
ncbi:MAG: RNA methyltransferase [Paludibacteraceae bacterium]|nr:RNA methyltransferase [Paludibacteraceae bacterium]